MKKILISLIVAVFILLGLSYFYLGLEERKPNSGLINEEEVLGSAIMANGLNYTLNFTQHTALLNVLNHSKRVDHPPLNPSTPQTITSILIYTAEQKEPIILTPLSDDFGYFKVSGWKKPDDYLALDQPQELQPILELAYNK